MALTIIIGIDFGTCYSRVAWAISTKPEDIHVVADWKSESNSKKVPTRINYNTANQSIKWGFATESEDAALERFKLLLLEDKGLDPVLLQTSEFKEARRLQQNSKRRPINIVADFLKHLWNHAVNSIQQQLPPNTIPTTRFHLIITVPGIWPPCGRTTMRIALREAGILDPRPGKEAATVQFITEPEAAALAIIQDRLLKSESFDLNIGDIVIVCEAGGGTVELITYKLESRRPLVLKEYVMGIGRPCGGLFVDNKFLNLVDKKKVLGSWQILTKRKLIFDRGWSRGIKRKFSGQKNAKWDLDVSDPASKKPKPELVRINTAGISPLFQSINSALKDMINHQLTVIGEKGRAKPKLVLLSGGFGRSPYIRRLFSEFLKKPVTVAAAKGSNLSDAICRGAVMGGIQFLSLVETPSVAISSRIARMNYGIAIPEVRRSSQQEPEYRGLDKLTPQGIVDERITWVVRQGDDVKIQPGFGCHSSALLQTTSLKSPTRYTFRLHQSPKLWQIKQCHTIAP